MLTAPLLIQGLLVSVAAAVQPPTKLLISAFTLHNVDAKAGTFNYTYLWADLGEPLTIGTGSGNSVPNSSNKFTPADPFIGGGQTGGFDKSGPALSVSNWVQPFDPHEGNFQVKATNFNQGLCARTRYNYAGSSNVTTGQTVNPPQSYPALYFPPFEIDLINEAVVNLAAINTVVTAPLELFSHTTTGIIANLFSQDISIVDTNLPLSFINLLVLGMMLIGGLAVVALPSPYLAISYPFVFAVLYSLQLFYLRTSRQLRLLDLEAKAPLYNQFLETTEGIATIRSFGWVEKAIKENSSLLNESQLPAYLLSMAQNFLTSTLNIIFAILATAATALATQLNANSSLTGASFVTLFNLSGRMATLMQSYTELEVSLGAVNRLATFSDSNPPESNKPNPIVPETSWPASGIIKMKGVSASYKRSQKPPLAIETSAQEAPHTLNNIRFTLVLANTWLSADALEDPINQEHSIDIDGIPIEQVDRDVLRQHLLVVPQDPVFLPPGYTIKQNLDLFDEATDQECIDPLQQTLLTTLLNDADGNGGIHAEFRAETLSHGRQQIFGFTRAVIRSKVRARMTGASGGVLILDEPNSNVDQDTDEAMQDIIRPQFAEYSVIYISHRLETIMNLCSRVIILNQGELVEQGNPAQLVDTQGSWFMALWQELKQRT